MSKPAASVEKLNLRGRFVGLDREVPLLDGRRAPYVNLDNAASTPPLLDVLDAVERFLPFYSSVHRGSGFKSRLSTIAYDRAHEIITRFVGADPETHVTIFGKNATEAINKLAHRLPLPPDSVILTTALEHHSNDLPWRGRAHVVYVRATPDGRLDEDDFDRKLAANAGRVKLVAVTGASNVTGFIQPVHRLARKAHLAGAWILTDAAQLAPHRPIDARPADHPEHLDFVALSAHKMYAPFGTGALVGPREIFLRGEPEYRGGGTVDVVTPDEIHWAGLPDREEAGSPNVVGAVAMAAAARALRGLGMDRIAAHEADLVAYALDRLRAVPGMRIYGDDDPARAAKRVGVIPFNLEGTSHYLVAAVLGYEGGIAVRSGCFCAHPYVVHLLGLSEAEQEGWRRKVLSGDKSDMPGLVRLSFGCYNSREDVDRAVAMLERIAKGDYRGSYRIDPESGEYVPEGYEEPLSEYFSLDKLDES
jgi:cysteine desulfurase/selenocysteine lyase